MGGPKTYAEPAPAPAEVVPETESASTEEVVTPEETKSEEVTE